MNRNLIYTSNSETNDEEDVFEIMHNVRRKVGGNIIHVNVSLTRMDNDSFHSETSIIVTKCNVEGIKKYRKVYDRGKCEAFIFYY